jgi:aa3 type cytochrome c oxidase subunit IV
LADGAVASDCGQATLSRLARGGPALLGERGQEAMMAESDAKDMKAHARSYDRFIFMMKWGTILSAITAAFVIFVISN